MTGSSSDAKVMASSEGNLSEKERARQLDGILGFGNYQWFQVNVYKYIIGTIKGLVLGSTTLVGFGSRTTCCSRCGFCRR